jgi:hypothetical protein
MHTWNILAYFFVHLNSPSPHQLYADGLINTPMQFQSSRQTHFGTTVVPFESCLISLYSLELMEVENRNSKNGMGIYSTIQWRQATNVTRWHLPCPARIHAQHIFFNKIDNSRLDAEKFAPFGEVISGMENIDRIYSGYGEFPNQGLICSQGNSNLEKNFPLMSYIKSAKFISSIKSRWAQFFTSQKSVNLSYSVSQLKQLSDNNNKLKIHYYTLLLLWNPPRHTIL